MEVSGACSGIMAGSKEASVLRQLLSLGLQLVNGEAGSLLGIDDAYSELVWLMTVGNDSEREKLVEQLLPIGEETSTLAARTRVSQVGVVNIEVVLGAPEQRAKAAARAVLASPVIMNDELLGVISAIGSQHKESFSKEDMAVYASVAEVIALIMEQARKLSAGKDARKDVCFAMSGEDSREEGRDVAEMINRLALLNSKERARIQNMIFNIDQSRIRKRLAHFYRRFEACAKILVRKISSHPSLPLRGFVVETIASVAALNDLHIPLEMHLRRGNELFNMSILLRQAGQRAFRVTKRFAFSYDEETPLDTKDKRHVFNVIITAFERFIPEDLDSEGKVFEYIWVGGPDAMPDDKAPESPVWRGAARYYKDYVPFSSYIRSWSEAALQHKPIVLSDKEYRRLNIIDLEHFKVTLISSPTYDTDACSEYDHSFPTLALINFRTTDLPQL